MDVFDQKVLEGLSPAQIAAIGRLFARGALPFPQAAEPAKTAETQDIEDGELSDHEPLTPDAAADASVIITQQDDALQHLKRRLSSPGVDDQPQRVLSREYYTRQEKQLEDFVRVMYSNGYGFNTIKNEVKDVDGLRAMYRKLSLPTDTQAAVSQPVIAKTQQPVGGAATQASRAEYLARLQAAKNKKTEIPVTQAADTKLPEVKPRVKKGLDPKKNELLKLKLAALRAEQASKQLQTNTALTSLMSRAGVQDASSKPLDALAGGHQSLVINVSDQEDVESELDDSVDGDAGVRLQPGAQHHAMTSSSSGTPGDGRNSELQQKMQDLEAARAKLAEMEERARARPSNTTTPVATSGLGAGLLAASMQPVVTPQSQYHVQAVPPVNQTADDASSVIDDDEDEYDDIYNATEGARTQSADAADKAEQHGDEEDDYAMDTADSELDESADETPVNFYEGEAVNDDSSSDSNAEAAVDALIVETSGSGTELDGIEEVPVPAIDSDTDASMDISDEEVQDDASAPMSEDSSLDDSSSNE